MHACMYVCMYVYICNDVSIHWLLGQWATWFLAPFRHILECLFVNVSGYAIVYLRIHTHIYYIYVIMHVMQVTSMYGVPL